jgi:hypothetical protein
VVPEGVGDPVVREAVCETVLFPLSRASSIGSRIAHPGSRPALSCQFPMRLGVEQRERETGNR